MLDKDYTMTKRHLGWLLLIGGVLGFIGVFSIDLIAIAREGGIGSLFSGATVAQLRGPLGIGPAQRLGLAACAGVALVGGTLIPLGDRPA
jgi:hypothetical protein